MLPQMMPSTTRPEHEQAHEHWMGEHVPGACVLSDHDAQHHQACEGMKMCVCML